MRTRVSLHAHERTASGDSLSSAVTMARRYRDQGFGAVGFVGHDSAPVETGDAVAAAVGVEHELRPLPRRLHVVEFPEHDFAFLAHPATAWPTDTRAKAAAFAHEHGLDGVEKYSRGRMQYAGSIPGLVELANDDAHNPHQVGESHMVVRVQDPDGPTRRVLGQVFDALRRDEFETVNRRRSQPRYVVGRVRQAVALSGHRAGLW